MSVLLIWVVTGILVYLAIQRIIDRHYELNATIMLITAAVGVGVNIMFVFACSFVFCFAWATDNVAWVVVFCLHGFSMVMVL